MSVVETSWSSEEDDGDGDWVSKCSIEWATLLVIYHSVVDEGASCFGLVNMFGLWNCYLT